MEGGYVPPESERKLAVWHFIGPSNFFHFFLFSFSFSFHITFPFFFNTLSHTFLKNRGRKNSLCQLNLPLPLWRRPRKKYGRN